MREGSTTRRPVALIAHVVALSLLLLDSNQGQVHGASCDLVSGKPELYGPIRDKGVLPEHVWFPSGYHRRSREFLQYMQTNHSAVESQGGPPLPQRAGCHHLIKINDKYKIMYIKNLKSAGTSLMYAFGRLNGGCDTCFRVLQASDEPTLMQKFKDYFVFTMIRNPFDRAVSSYEYILSLREKNWEKYNTERSESCRAPTFREFCERPYLMGLQDLRHSCYSSRESHGGVLGEKHDFTHVEPIFPCLFTQEEQPAFDYAIRMENMMEDFEDMRIHHINTPERRRQGIPNLPKISIGWERMPEPEQDGVQMNRHMSNFDDCGDGCISAVANYYAKDLQLFGFPRNEAECLRQQQSNGPHTVESWNEDML